MNFLRLRYPIYAFLLCSLFFSTTAISQNIDTQILLDINKNHSPFLDDFMKGISNSAAYVTLTIPLGIGIYGLAKNENVQRENSLYVISSVLFSSAFTYAIKDIVQRVRPNHANIIGLRILENENSYSFPSGHATGAFAFATSLTLAYPKWYVAVVTYTFAGLVAYSRPYLGVHYPSDVLAGAVIGSSVSMGLYFAKKKWLDPLTKKKIQKQNDPPGIL